MMIKFKDGAETYTYNDVELIDNFIFENKEYVVVNTSGHEVEICKDDIIILN